jgi:hypothetical protein
VSDNMQIMNEEAHWYGPFCRAAQDWEVEVVVAKWYETRCHKLFEVCFFLWCASFLCGEA